MEHFVRRRLPCLLRPYERLRTFYHAGRTRLVSIARHARGALRTPRSTFERIYWDNHWGGSESRSGPGSSLAQTDVIRRALPARLQALGVRVLLDIPCGDMHWQRHMDLAWLERYLGADIVAALIERNRRRIRDARFAFLHLDVVGDRLPRADAVLCRDCLVHLPNRLVRRALTNIRRSGADWLITTTFPRHDNEGDIVVGDWRPLNLERPPFCLPPPLELINEACTDAGGCYADKSLGIWRIRDIP